MSDSGLIAPGFLFSQHSLHTYVHCPQRFLLKYVERLPWPMLEDEDPRGLEQNLARGRTLHQWIARQHLGLDMEPLVAACGDEELQAWWRAYKQFDYDPLPMGLREAELALIVPLGDYRLYARYDYIALAGEPHGEAVIVDWKTLGARPSARTLRERIQTRVYLYTLVTAGHVLTGGAPIDAAQAHMYYWFANFPDDPEDVRYSEQRYRQDRDYIAKLVQEIASTPREGFARSEEVRLCARCAYRGLCERQPPTDASPTLDWLEEEADFDLVLEDVPELEY